MISEAKMDELMLQADAWFAKIMTKYQQMWMEGREDGTDYGSNGQQEEGQALYPAAEGDYAAAYTSGEAPQALDLGLEE